jgi:hypothetical protein
VDRAATSWRRELSGSVANIDTRIDAIDLATVTRLDTVTKMIDAQREIIMTELKVIETQFKERFSAIETQFRERDTRAERESRDNKVAVDAAFAAQATAVAKQDESNLKAIDKSERATAKTIETNAELFQSSLSGQNQVLSDLKDRVVQMEARIVQALASKQEARTAQNQGISVVVAVFVGVSLLVSIAGVFISLRQ